MTDPGPTSPPLLRDRQISSTTTTSRPLSEISDNNGEQRRSTTRESLKTRSRPSSEVKDFAPEREAKRASLTMQQTITLNLNDYASSVAKQESPLPSPTPPSAFDGTWLGSVAKPAGPGLGAWAEMPVTGDISGLGEDKLATLKGKEKAQGAQFLEPQFASSSQPTTESTLAPAGPIHSTLSSTSLVPPISSAASTTSFDTARSSVDAPQESSRFTSKPRPPQWLRKASESSLTALRVKSRSPKVADGPLPEAPVLAPRLPPRGVQASSSSRSDGRLPSAPPAVPRKSNEPLDPGHSRASTYDSSDRPSAATRKSSRDNIGRRIAAWTANAQSAFPRSASSASLSSQITTASNFNQTHQRTHSQAQKVIDGAGAAVQKGLAGLKARGVGGSISSLSSLAQSGRSQHSRNGSTGPAPGWVSGFGTRSSKDHSRSVSALAATSEGPEFEDAIVMRLGNPHGGPVFGRNLVEAGQATHVMDANVGDEFEKRRRHCLPAIVIRCVEYLEIWGPKEEGIFRISGRSSHISRLKKEFDAGADIDLRQCHPGDLDPHAVAGLFKQYLRELPSSILTPTLLPPFDAYAKAKYGSTAPMLSVSDLDRETDHVPDRLDTLLSQLPPAHWFLIADIVKLLDLIPRHEAVNRMTPNALMISLGPSVNIPGGILTEFLTRRTQLFSKPPQVEEDRMTDLIDFGSVSIAPPSIPQATMVPLKPEQQSPLPRSSTPQSQVSDDSPPYKTTRSRRMSSKPSLSRLFTSSSRNIAQLDVPPSEPSSTVDAEPPRVDLVIDEMSPLPNFGKVPSPAVPPVDLPSETELVAEPTEMKPAEEPTTPISVSVKERVKAYPISSTPIADRFAKAETNLPPLRPNSLSSTISTHSPARNSYDNPATIIKRGQSPFFSGPSTSPRSSHSRNPSGSILDKRSSTSSVREMVRDMEKRDAA